MCVCLEFSCIIVVVCNICVALYLMVSRQIYFHFVHLLLFKFEFSESAVLMMMMPLFGGAVVLAPGFGQFSGVYRTFSGEIFPSSQFSNRYSTGHKTSKYSMCYNTSQERICLSCPSICHNTSEGQS